MWNTVQGKKPGSVTLGGAACHLCAQSVTRIGGSVTFGQESVTIAAPEVSPYADASVTRKGVRGG